MKAKFEALCPQRRKIEYNAIVSVYEKIKKERIHNLIK